MFGSHVGARAPASAPTLRALRIVAHVLLHQRHHRQPRRARVAPLRAAGRSDRRRRLAPGRAPVRGVAATTASTCIPGHARQRTPRPRCCSLASSPTATRRSRSPAAARAPSSSPPMHVACWPHEPSRAAVAAYRAGYLANERRELEAQLDERRARRGGRHQRARARHRRRCARRSGAQRLPGHAGVDAPTGRAGPDAPTRRAAAVLIAGDDQLDQWYARHPAELLDRPAEAVVVNPDNPFVARAQIACAAHELPLTHADDRYFGDALDDAVRDLVLDDGSSRAAERCTGPGARHRGGAGRACGRARRSSASSSTPTVAWWARSTRARAFHVAHPARSTCTRAVSTACASSTSSTRWPCSTPPTTPTSTPSPARRPTSRSSPPRHRRRRAPASPTSAR